VLAPFSESVVDRAALAWLESLGWQIKHSCEISAGEFKAKWTFGRDR
jgi:type I restriction enzyme R subunit